MLSKLIISTSRHTASPGFRDLLIIAALAALLPCQVWGQPDWFKNPEEKYPGSRFLYGLGMGTSGDKAERMQLAEENARSNLIKSIRTQISSEFVDETTESSRRLDSYTQSRIVSTAALEVDGIRLDRRQEKGRTAYALALLDKAEGRRLHSDKIARLNRELTRRLKQAKRYEKEGQTEKALKAHLELYPLLTSREETETVLLALGDFGQTAFAELDELMDEEKMLERAAVDQAIERLTSSDFTSLDGAAAALAFRLGAQLQKGKRVIVLPPTYGETKFTSTFSRYMAKTLGYKLADAGLRPVEAARGFEPRTSDHRREFARQAGAEILVTGSYLEKGENLKLFLLASDVATALKSGAADVELETGLVKREGLDFLPQNFQQALQDAGLFGKGELIGGSLQVEVWTDRGSENLYLEEEEEVTLTVRANQPCYVRVIYHLANRMRVLLYGNYYIREGMVNQAVTMPDTFYVAEPFGVEVIQALASLEPFPEIPTRDWEGYPVLTDDLEQFIAQTRGLKKKKTTKQVAEMRVTLTTMPRK